MVTNDREYAVAADPDRDRIWLAPMQLTNGVMLHELLDASVSDPSVLPTVLPMQPARPFELAQGAHPGRVVETEGGLVLVVLRGLGEVVALRIEESTLQETWRTRVCSEPRGITIDPAEDTTLVACRDGMIASLDAATGLVEQQVQLPWTDLRDIVLDDRGDLYVSTFRTAQVFRLNRGSVSVQDSFDLAQGVEAAGRVASVAWRMRAIPGGGVIISHQLARSKQDLDEPMPEPVEVTRGGYGGSRVRECRGADSIVLSAVTRVTPGPSGVRTDVTPGAVLPVDVVSMRGTSSLIVAAGDAGALQQEPDFGGDSDGRSRRNSQLDFAPVDCFGLVGRVGFGDGRQATALATLSSPLVLNRLAIVQTRNPWGLEIRNAENLMRGGDSPGATRSPERAVEASIDLPGADRRDTGLDLFHEDSGAGIACASCHPEGGDDAQVWHFAGLGVRRTPQLSGGILAETAPFHWIGDMTDFGHLSHEVFSSRMGGPELTPELTATMARWIDTVEPAKPSDDIDESAIARGASIFYSDEANCASCHSGGFFTNNQTVDVGTGLELQVPPLVGLDGRGRYMHDGCAETLMDRFTDEACGGGDQHGKTSHLSGDELGDLVSFLRTL